MMVRTLAGRYAGQVVELAPEVAIPMLDDGRALLPEQPYRVHGSPPETFQSVDVPESLRGEGQRLADAAPAEEREDSSGDEEIVRSEQQPRDDDPLVERAPPMVVRRPQRPPAASAATKAAEQPKKPGSMSLSQGKAK
jgi:hypothetical protein